MATNWSKATSLTMLGMFTAIIFLLNFTPLGFVLLPFGRATTLHIPVIVGSIIMGPKYGAILGFMFGAASLMTATMAPVLSSFVFSPFIPVPGTDRGNPLALVVAFGPRILVGVIPWYIYKWLGKITPERFQMVHLPITAAIGSLSNTLLVMHLWYFIFREPWAYARGEPVSAMYPVVTAIIASAGLAEAVVAAVIVPAVCMALFSVSRRLARRQARSG